MYFTSLHFHFVTADGKPVRWPIQLHVLRGLFMNAVASVKPSLASRLHDGQAMSDFSTRLHVDGDSIHVTYNLFSDELNEALRDFILQRDDLHFMIGRIETLLVKVGVERVHVGDLIDDARPVERARIVFKTPTFFKSGGTVILFPQPEILFKHLAHSWNELLGGAGLPIDELALAAWVKEHVRISAYRLETASVSIGGGDRVNTGFKGWATFIIKKDDALNEWPVVLDRLLRFAEHANVGGGRNTGLGAVVCQPRHARASDRSSDEVAGNT
ncbi:MAG: CRISPR system precrRNA processing endoribonuclease RAMP protein Cas6 [Candidatus Lokiarchaeota archaeon]|nr:CRISPR system precrRNA processing endoribonuclease RAMP protein Cas6 [Candidatus Lokiarchaeota archaeon]